MRLWRKFLAGAALVVLANTAQAQDISNLPRKETVISENLEGTVKNPG